MKALVMIGCIGLSVAVVTTTFAAEEEAKEDEKLDAKLGLAEEPFVINLAALRTRTDLREAARIRTGLPTYDQQVEHAEGSPSSLVAELRQAAASPPTPERRAPAASSGGNGTPASNGQDNGSAILNCPITHVGPCQ